MKNQILTIVLMSLISTTALSASISAGVSTVTKSSERNLYTPIQMSDGSVHIVHRVDKESETVTVPTLRVSEGFKLNKDLHIELGLAYNEVKTSGYLNSSLSLTDRLEAYAGINQALENGLGAQIGVNYLVGDKLSIYGEIRQEKEHYRPDWSEHKETTYNSTNFGFKVNF